MRNSHILFGNDLLRIFRTPRLLLWIALTALILLPATVFFYNGVSPEPELSGGTYIVGVVTADESVYDFVKEKLLGTAANLRVISASQEGLLEQGTADALIVMGSDYQSKLDSMKSFAVKLLYDSSNTRSIGAARVASAAVADFNASIVSQRLLTQGIDASVLTPALCSQENISTRGPQSAKAAGSGIPVLFTLFLLLSIALMARILRHKQRETLPLLCAYISGPELFWSRFSVLTIAGLMIALLQFAGLYLGSALAVRFGQVWLPVISPSAALMLLVMTILQTLFIVSVLLMAEFCCAEARGSRYLLAAARLFLLLLTVAALNFHAGTVALGYMFVPVYNLVCSAVLLISGAANERLLLAVCASLSVTAIFLLIGLWRSTRKYSTGR